MAKTEVNDIIQITDDTHHWFPCLLIVSEAKSWGVQAYAHIPSNEGKRSQAFNRLKDGEYEVVGKAVIVPQDQDEG